MKSTTKMKKDSNRRKVIVKRDLCIGCGICVLLASKTFKLNKEGKAEVISQGKGSEKEIKEVIDSCPVGAISYQKES